MPGVARYANERAADGGDTDIAPELLHLICQQPIGEAAPFLAAIAADFYDDLPEELLEALARVGAPAPEPLLDVYERKRDEPGELATALAFLKVSDPRVEAIFAEQAEEEASFLRDISTGEGASEPFDIFAQYPETAVPVLVGKPLKVRKEFLASQDATHRMAALSTFLDGKLGPGMPKALERMAREDEDPEVRGVAWETLEGEAGEDKRLLAEMRARLANPSVQPKERAGLLVALAQLGSEGYAQLADALYQDRATRARALQAMWRSFDRDFAKYAVESLEDEDPDIREQAILATGYLNQASEAARLEKLFHDDTHRDTALFAYALCAPAEVTRARMKQLFRTIDKLAGGLGAEDAQTVEQALDLRLEMHGLPPVFETEEEDEEPLSPAASGPTPGRNDPCPCGSGKKYKKCHGQ
jgi:hypothetical protein